VAAVVSIRRNEGSLSGLESGVRTLRELSRSYLAVSKDLTRVMNRLKALYRSWAIPCAGQEVYFPRHRAVWLEKLREAGCLLPPLFIVRPCFRKVQTESNRHTGFFCRDGKTHGYPAVILLSHLPAILASAASCVNRKRTGN
jgi:hypothetical protein